MITVRATRMPKVSQRTIAIYLLFLSIISAFFAEMRKQKQFFCISAPLNLSFQRTAAETIGALKELTLIALADPSDAE